MENNLTIYTTPTCQQCRMTYMALERAGLDYTVIDVTTNPDALERVKKLGYTQAPVVEVDATNHWAGFRPDLISALSGTRGAAA